jgi:hypothetical protein
MEFCQVFFPILLTFSILYSKAISKGFYLVNLKDLWNIFRKILPL